MTEPDLMREAVKALEEVEAILAAAPLDGFRRYTYKLTMAEANRAVGLVRDIKAILTARLSSPAPAQGEVASPEEVMSMVRAERQRCADIALAIDSGRGNEKEIARAILHPMRSAAIAGLKPRAAPAQGEVDAIARMVALTELRRQISTEGRNWFRDRECVGPIDYQGIDIAEIVRVAIAAALHPQQEAQARPDHDWFSPPLLERNAPEWAARIAEQADETGPHGYRLESGALKQSIAAAIRSLAPVPQGDEAIAQARLNAWNEAVETCAQGSEALTAISFAGTVGSPESEYVHGKIDGLNQAAEACRALKRASP